MGHFAFGGQKSIYQLQVQITTQSLNKLLQSNNYHLLLFNGQIWEKNVPTCTFA